MKATIKPTPVPLADAWLSPSDLDEEVGRRVKRMAERLAGSGYLPDHLSDIEKQTFQSAQYTLMSKRKADFWENVQVWLLYATLPLALFVIVPLLSRAFAHDNFAEVVLLESLVALLIVGQISLFLWRGRIKSTMAALPHTVGLALRFVKHKNSLEEVYCQAAAALLLEPPSVWGGPQAARHLLHDLRDLFQVGKQAAAKRAQIKQAMSYQSLAEVDVEVVRLAQRVEAAGDAEARATLQQSLAHLEARRARVRAMEPLRQRLEAQEEAVYQALREAQTALSSPVWISETNDPHASERAAVPGATSWSETAARLRQQTHAVEAAVQEVMQVGVGENGGG